MIRPVVIAALALLALPATSSGDALSDCIYDHDLDKRYSPAELKEAIDEIPTDHDEYGLCREILTNAMHGGSEGGQGAGSSEPVSPDEQAQRAEDARELAAIARDAGRDSLRSSPEGATAPMGRGAPHAFDLTAGDELPTPLLLALIALGVITVAAGLVTLHERLRTPGET